MNIPSALFRLRLCAVACASVLLLVFGCFAGNDVADQSQQATVDQIPVDRIEDSSCAAQSVTETYSAPANDDAVVEVEVVNTDLVAPTTENALTDQSQSSAQPTVVSQIAQPQIPRDLPDAVPEDVAVIWEAFQFINDEYVDYERVDHDKMSEQAILGFIEALEDPHMTYITPERMRMSRDDLAGSFFGIGCRVSMAPDGKGVIIQTVFEGSPAKTAGIKAGDRIVKVDGEDATDWDVTTTVLKIRGEEGVPVLLQVLHVGDTDPVDIEIIRGRIQLESVFSRLIPDTRFGELDITTFTDETPGEIRAHMQDLLDQGAEGVVIDLRNNPGGLLNSTLDSASEFITNGRLAYEQDRNGVRRDFYAHGEGNFTDVPVVVLVNEWSGSGAELFAGAFQDLGRAVLIGVKTFGKGSVNITRTLSNGAGLNITIRRWYTPNGNVIEGEGLTPDVVVEADDNPDQRDVDWVEPQMDAAIKQLNFQTRVTTSR